MGKRGKPGPRSRAGPVASARGRAPGPPPAGLRGGTGASRLSGPRSSKGKAFAASPAPPGRGPEERVTLSTKGRPTTATDRGLGGGGGQRFTSPSTWRCRTGGKHRPRRCALTSRPPPRSPPRRRGCWKQTTPPPPGPAHRRGGHPARNGFSCLFQLFHVVL